jgi:hypothetical protein
MHISAQYPMKVLHTQWVMNPLPALAAGPSLDVEAMPPITFRASLLLEESKHLYQEGMIGRLYCPSTCVSAASAWGSQNGMSMAW